MDKPLAERLAAAAAAVTAELDRNLSAVQPGEIERPARLLDAVRYAALSGGKRLRPYVLIESARLFGRDDGVVVGAAAALECIHCYSLAHDDLPAMDDDDLRRGRPTVHRRFDEATAILVGDGLLTLAFDILARLAEDSSIRIALVGLFARAAGIGGMVGGQMLDMAAEGEHFDEDRILRLQAMKTAALFACAAEAGAVLGRAGDEDRRRMLAFGRRLGQVFQVADDLIDATGAADVAGKRTAKDAARGKATLVALTGIEAARDRLAAMVEDAAGLLAPFGHRAGALLETARFAAGRNR